MSTEVRHRRGTAAQHATFTGAESEFTHDTTNNAIRVHDGATAGGNRTLMVSEKAQANGVASLDGTGNVPLSQLGNVPASATVPSPSGQNGKQLVVESNAYTLKELAKFDRVNYAPTAGSLMGIEYLLEDTTALTLRQLAGIWPDGQVGTYVGISKQFNSGDLTGVAPATALFSYTVNNGVTSDVVGQMIAGYATANNSTVFGANIIAGAGAVTNPKLVGLEVDVLPSTGFAPTGSSGGIFLNSFNHPCSVAMQLGGVGGGTFSNGFVSYAVSGAAFAIGSGSILTSALNTSGGSFTDTAIVLGNQQGVRFNNTTAAALVASDTGGNLLLSGSSAVVASRSSTTEGQAIFSANDGTGVQAMVVQIARGSPANGSNAAVKINGQSVTGRSINAGGTINASGADYAEYELVKDNLLVEKGAVIGFDSDGKVTDQFDDAISFAVKSTAPNLVGGDDWHEIVGQAPIEPVYVELDIAHPTPPETHVRNDESKNEEGGFGYRRLSETEYSTLYDSYEKEVLVYNELKKNHRDEWLATEYADYLSDKQAFEDLLNEERKKYDRIAYCGKVPVNVYGAEPGQWIIPVRTEDGKISASAQTMSRSSALDAETVGRVKRILDDGRAEIIVTI